MTRAVMSISLSIIFILTGCTSEPFPYSGLFASKAGEYRLLWIDHPKGKLEVPEIFAKLSGWERNGLKAAKERYAKIDLQSVPMIYIFDHKGVALQTTKLDEAVAFLEKHIKVKDQTIIGSGESDHWYGQVKYEFNGDLILGRGQLSFLKDPPPKKIEYEIIHTTPFPTRASGKIEHFKDFPYEFSIGGGGGSINSRDTISTITEGVNQMYILVKWEEEGNSIEERIDLNVIHEK